MKFNYKLKRLCGAYYGHPMASSQRWSGSNLVFDSTGNLLLSAVSNRVQVLDLQNHSTRTLPVEARSNIQCLALSPDNSLLLIVDVQHYAMLVQFHRGIVLHRFQLKQAVRQVAFSWNAQYMAVTHGKHLQVWCTLAATAQREFAPLVLHRTYTGPSDSVTCLDWSRDSSVLLGGSRDGTVRIWTLHTTRGFQPVTLSGHRREVVGAFFGSGESDKSTVYSISEDGAMVTWEYTKEEDLILPDESKDVDDEDVRMDESDAVNFFTSGDLPAAREGDSHTELDLAHALVGAKWKIKVRHYFHQDRATVTSCNYCVQQQLLSVGFSNGVFALYELPSCATIHSLSVGQGQLVKSCVLNQTGEWLALGCPSSQQLLVWEWRSETYVLKQRGHAYGMRCMAYSPDGIVICTGGEDGKIKLWNATSGFCYVTLEKSHTAPITGVAFANSSVVLSSSLDGTVRAHDLHRYRTFKTLTTPTPVQFLNVAVDPSGEIVLAGSTEPFHIYSWNLQTGKLLDIFTGHSGPVSALAFQSNGGMLASASWDGTVKLWDLYKDKVPTESLQHTSDVVCVTYRPDGKEICSGTIGGLLSFWDVENARLKFEIDGRRDIAGGRKLNDRMTADNNAASRYFTSVCYSADGTCVIAGGNSKYVCIYEVSQQILLKKFQVTYNRSLDGVLDEVRSNE
jgi:periodic tryptophan protein 2